MGLKDIYSATIDLFRKTSLEILVGGVIGAVALGFISGHYENARTKKIPLGFSEITQWEEEGLRGNISVGEEPISYFYASTNDICMKVFEAWNLANGSITFDFDGKFARELEVHTESTYKEHHYNLKSFFAVIGDRASKAFAKFGEFVKVHGKMGKVNNAFNNTWDYSSIDTTHQECHDVESCTTDSDGDEHCTTHEECTTVCDYTTHDYTYHRDAGEEASRLIDLVLSEHPSLNFPEDLRMVKKTNAEGEYAAEVSREKQKDPLYTQRAELLKIANTWNFGSTYSANRDEAMSLWKSLHPDSDQWRRDKNTAHDETFITPCGMSESPEEYDTVERALQHSEDFTKLVGEIIGGIEYVQSTAPKLDQLIDEFIHIKLDHREGNAKKLRKEIMKTTKEIYKANFKNGFDVDRFRWYVFLPLILLGGAVGAGVGYGVDRLTSRGENRYDKSDFYVGR